MDVFVATSRGRGLEEYFSIKSRTAISVLPGGLLEDLTEKAERLLVSNPHKYEDVQDLHPNFVYVLGGLPDLTEKVKDRNYLEIIYNESTTTTTPKMITKLLAADQKIKSLNAIPCFSTISPMSLDTWNHHRLYTNKTSYLVHHHHYSDMNHLLNESIMDINNFIMDLNNINNVETPNFAASIIKKRGRGRDYRIKYNKLVDGCHPTKDVIKKWTVDLDIITSNNRYRNATKEALADFFRPK